MLINPAGVVEAGPVIGEEILLTAEFNRDDRRATKAIFDAVGHYSRWDAVNLEISEERLAPIHSHHGPKTPVPKDGRLAPDHVRDLAEEHEVSIDTIEAILDEISQYNALIGEASK